MIFIIITFYKKRYFQFKGKMIIFAPFLVESYNKLKKKLYEEK